MLNSYKLIILIFNLFLFTHSQINNQILTTTTTTPTYQVITLPTANYLTINGNNLTQASPKACYADCQSCQIQTNQCQQCYSPYFLRLANAQCQINPGYVIQSSNNQLQTGGAFILATESWNNQRVTNCANIRTGTFFINPMVAIQPVDPNIPLRYDRTLSLHHYIVIRFQLIASGWNAGSSMTIDLFNQVGARIIPQSRMNYLDNIPKQSLCSSSAIDQRFSVTVRVQDRNTTALGIVLQGFSGSISVVTWLVLTGQCHISCSTCSYSNLTTSCLGCNYFLQQISDGSCSQCPSGFRLVTANGLTYCQKCSIQYQQCSAGNQICYYPQLNASIASNCLVQGANSYYRQYTQINSQQFAGSLWTVGGLPSRSQYIPCGNAPTDYTYIGYANAFQPVTRIFANLQQHLQFSISFNVFAVDVGFPFGSSRNTKFEIYLNNNLYDIKYLQILAMSDVCASSAPQSFTTFPPTTFYKDNSTTMNLTIVADTVWGIRDLRIVFMKCDTNCVNCGNNGCLQCSGLLQNINGRCQGCPLGYGIDNGVNINQNGYCFKCQANCLNCTKNILPNTYSCTLCSAPFFLFQGNCVLRTNVGNILTPPPLSLPPNIPSPSLTCDIAAVTNSSSTNQSNSSVNQPFTYSSSTLTSQLTISQQHYKQIVQFQLIRVGQWQSTDVLDVYLNDLLILRKSYSQYGNQICSSSTNNNSTDYLSFQSVQFVSSNSTLTIFFQLVSTTTNATATYGIRNIKVYPIGCQACLTYPFTYKIDYNYDQTINIAVSFSRTYRQTNQTLFKEIFILSINNVPLSYKIVDNNSVTYNLEAFPPREVILGTIVLECRYPELVTTDINDTINAEQPFFRRLQQYTQSTQETQQYTNSKSNRLLYNIHQRLLQKTYTNSKIVDNSVSSIGLTRFSPVQSQSAVNGVRTFFQIMSRVVIYLGFAMFFFGLQTVTTHLMHNLQKIWLHIFLAALTAPALLRRVLTGFRQTQNQNIAINPTKWQQPLPLQLYYSSRTFLYQYYTDINFLRNIYNIGLAFGILMLYLLFMYIVTKKCISRERTKQSNFLRHLKVTFHRRPYFYFNSVIFYQYLTLVFACTLQFTDLTNQTQQGAFGGISAAGAIVAFVFATIYPLFHLFWLRYKKNDLGYNLKSSFANRYHQIFFRFVHRNIWSEGQISYAQQFYNIYRFGQIWWYCVVITAITYSPIAQLFLLLITQALHMFVILYTGLSRNIFFRIVKVLELALFVGLQIILLVCQIDSDTLTNQSYNTLGGVAIALVFLIVALSVLRTIYNGFMLYRQYQYKNQTRKIYVNQARILRQDEYYNSDQEQTQREGIVGTQRDR